MSLFNRYLSGDYETVWNEIRRFSNSEAHKNQDILDVVSTTMERVAKNADLLSERLQRAGWKTLELENDSLRTKASTDDLPALERMRKITDAPLPLSIEKFWRIVGGINWVWDYKFDGDPPDFLLTIAIEEMDPLCIPSPKSIEYQITEWESGEHHLMRDLDDGYDYCLDLAPDYLHKVNVSGGDPYSIYFPSPSPDPIHFDSWRDLPLVDYLRLSFRWGGFPRLEEHKNEPDVQAFVKEFTSGLISF